MSRFLRFGPRPIHGLSLARAPPFASQVAAIATTRLASSSSSSFLQTGPSPPRLPPDQQAEFERLQRAAEAAFSSHTTIPAAAEADSPLTTSRHVSTPSSSSVALPPSQSQEPQTQTQTQAQAAPLRVDSEGAGTFSGGLRQGAPPEFEGPTNPRTGEVGGPKNEPLRWGSAGDWSFNGRVTDF